MAENIYIGVNSRELTSTDVIFKPITRVTIVKDNNTSYTAGNDTGRTLTISDCPWGTQAMATAILAQVSGYAYQPYTATDAILDPAAEIGDAITVGGVYSVIAQTDINFDNAGFVKAAAPVGQEINSEYPYLPKLERKAQNAQSAANSAWNAANNAQKTADEAYSKAENAQETAEVDHNIITGWQYEGSSVKINGKNILAGTVQASSLLGGEVGLLNGYGTKAGALNITGATTSDFSIQLQSSGALRLVAVSGAIYLISGGGESLMLYNNGVVAGGNLYPSGHDFFSLGTNSFKWTDVYATNGTIQTSDRQAKRDIVYDLSDYDDLYDELKPVTYKFADGHRTHVGFIAQDIEQTLNDLRIDTEDFAGFVKSPREDGYNYALRYTEFIAMNTAQIQKLKKRIKEQDEEIAALKEAIAEIKAAIGG